ncbi:hypothetical protein Cus16_2856 [Curtobacterium sp. ER1/6]|nr:hypothetical protein Cus16_2856 [Curtobacterium sp. ER1/6]
MVPLVGVRVRERRRTQQRLTHERRRPAVRTRRAGDVVPVRGVVRDGDAEPRLRDVHPAVRRGLEPRHVPRGVLVRRPVDVPELDLARRHRRPHVERERELEELLPLVPLDLGLDVQLGLPRGRRVPGGHRRRAEGARHDERIAEHLDGGRRQDGPVPLVGAVDVPRLPLVRGVPEHRVLRGDGARCDGVASGSVVDERHDVPARVDGRRDDAGVEDEAVAVPDGRHGLLRRRHGTTQGGHPARRDGRGVEAHHGPDLGAAPGPDRTRALRRVEPAAGSPGERGRRRPDPGERRRPTARERGRRRPDQSLEDLGDPGVLGLGVLVDPGDRRPRQDVVELLQEHGVPHGLELVVRVLGAEPHGRGRRPELGLAEQVLGSAVALLRADLRGVRAAVELEVHFPRPHRGFRQDALELLEHLRGGAEVDPRRAVEVVLASGRRDHLAGGPTAAVAEPVQQHRRVRDAALLVAAFAAEQVGGGDVRVVGVGRGKVRQDAGAVDALPVERRVRDDVRLVPRGLLRDEPLRAGGPDDLRQRAGVAERVGQPGLGGVDAELLEEQALPGDELAREGLTTGQVGVRLDPHAADGDPAALGHALLDAGPDRRVPVADPGVLLCGRAREGEVGVLVHQVEHVRERPGALADRLADRPEPGGVDVRVSDGDGAVRGGAGGHGEGRGEHGAGLRGGARDVVRVEGIGGALEHAEQVGAAGAVGRELGHQAAEHPDVLLELPHGVVALDELERAQPVDRLRPGGRPGPERCRALEVVATDVRVRGGLDVQLEGAAGADLDGHGVVARLDALDRRAVGAPGESLGLEAGLPLREAEVDAELDRGAGVGAEVVGHGAPHAEPRGAPGAAAPRAADRERRVLGGDGLGERDGLVRHVPGVDGDRGRAAVHGGVDAVADETGDPGFDERFVVVHGGGSFPAGTAVGRAHRGRTGSALDAAGEGVAAPEAAGHEHVEGDHGHGVDDREGGELPVGDRAVLPEEVEDAHRGGHLVGREQQDERDEEVPPGLDEHEDEHDRDAGAHERHDDPRERGEHRGAVGPRRLLEGDRHRVHEVLRHPDRHRQARRGEEEDAAPHVVDQVERHEQRVDGHHHRRDRQPGAEQDAVQERLVDAHLVAGQRVRGEQREHHGDDRGAAGEQQAVRERDERQLRGEHLREVVERELRRQLHRQRRLGVHRRQHEPEQGHREADGDDEQDDVRHPAHGPPARGGHVQCAGRGHRAGDVRDGTVGSEGHGQSTSGLSARM